LFQPIMNEKGEMRVSGVLCCSISVHIIFKE